MLKKKVAIIKSCHEKPILIDTTIFEGNPIKGVVIFSHGFKGFKDWGPFNKIAEYFAENGFVFVKFNFSHNGTSPNSPIDFVDLDAFGNNNFCKELDELGLIVDWVNNLFKGYKITLFGHSRGGAISMLKTAEPNKVSNVISWASPSNLLNRFPVIDKLKKWKKTNVAYIYNGRTKQNMPMYYQFYENCLANSDRLNVEKSVTNMRIPHLHVHGSDDITVLIDEAKNIKYWNPNTKLHIIDGADHVFGGFHPYNLNVFPVHLQEALDVTINFLEV